MQHEVLNYWDGQKVRTPAVNIWHEQHKQHKIRTADRQCSSSLAARSWVQRPVTAKNWQDNIKNVHYAWTDSLVRWTFVKHQWVCWFFDIGRSVHHHTIQINKLTRCDSFTSLLLDVYVPLNMFRAPPRPSSGAYNCINSLWFYLGTWW